ncbi:arginase [Deinococcus sp. Arct2-2]|uniref:arginase n=1 Tax=Deinococcus sp. Arct2-2 TaxID=2568653 RepID=UPI0010A2F857|nr:arginase [Deinococcus sp. Arct2-2]THF66779.1 arginase [Deinococcus sp. Arct2-2]
MLLSIDWDAYSGCADLVFDAPIWGTRDLPADRMEAWQTRTLKRNPEAQNWTPLDADYPLYPGWEALERYAGCPAWVTLSHADAWGWLEEHAARTGAAADVLNIDSHHDLASRSGDPARVRPGNWAGLGLSAGLIGRYECLYPAWHAGLAVAEGFDLERTFAEVAGLLPPELLPRIALHRMAHPDDGLPDPAQVSGVLLVQSPAWTSPAHDAAFWQLARHLKAQELVPPLQRVWRPPKLSR